VCVCVCVCVCARVCERERERERENTQAGEKSGHAQGSNSFALKTMLHTATVFTHEKDVAFGDMVAHGNE
jgi:hypothetical protein